MPSFSRNDVVLVAYPFSDRTGVKVRPAVVVSGPHRSRDLFVVPLTSRADRMAEGEFSLADWRSAGLNMASVVKRGLFTGEKGDSHLFPVRAADFYDAQHHGASDYFTHGS